MSSTTKAPVFRKGNARPEAVFLRQFPGKKRWERVSQDDWNEPLPKRDIAGFGHILRLEADVRVFGPDGAPTVAKKWVSKSCGMKWASKSYIRNFARILRNIFGQNVGLVDTNAATYLVALNQPPFTTGIGFISQIFPAGGAGTGTQQNPEFSGAAMAIGDGVAAPINTRNDLVSRVGGIYSARNNLSTTALTTSTTTLQVTTGVTNAQNTTVNITEIGMFLYAIPYNSGSASVVPFATLIAYDGITSTPVATGGVIAPRYTMDFPI
jgi:hypothetical protein